MLDFLNKNKLFFIGFIFGVVLSAFFDFAIWLEVLIVLLCALTISAIGYFVKSQTKQ